MFCWKDKRFYTSQKYFFFACCRSFIFFIYSYFSRNYNYELCFAALISY
jgi:hypothetical protein